MGEKEGGGSDQPREHSQPQRVHRAQKCLSERLPRDDSELVAAHHHDGVGHEPRGGQALRVVLVQPVREGCAQREATAAQGGHLLAEHVHHLCAQSIKSSCQFGIRVSSVLAPFFSLLLFCAELWEFFVASASAVLYNSSEHTSSRLRFQRAKASSNQRFTIPFSAEGRGQNVSRRPALRAAYGANGLVGPHLEVINLTAVRRFHLQRC